MSKDNSDFEARKARNIEKYGSWQYNVMDKYKSMTTEEIKADLAKTAISLSVCFENWHGDLNIASGMRNANAFNLKQIYYLGKRKIDPRGAVGVLHYTPYSWLQDRDALLSLKVNHSLICVENNMDSIELPKYDWVTKKEPIIIFGEELTGISKETLELSDATISIPQLGSVRSINCAAATAIIMYDYCMKILWGNKDRPSLIDQ